MGGIAERYEIGSINFASREAAQIQQVAREYGVSPQEFGNKVHDYKQEGFRGTKNDDKGDFTLQELRDIAEQNYGQASKEEETPRLGDAP